MPGLDEPITVDGQPTTIRDLHGAGLLELGEMNHLDADDWQGGTDLFYVQQRETRDMWPVSAADFMALQNSGPPET